MANRHNQILKILTENTIIEVTKLAELLNVSSVTTRKDLDQLEQRGLIKREHGYAQLTSRDDINNRLAYNYDIKQKIAKLASTFVSEGETVMIESGSCCTLLAYELAANVKDITIITNSVFIAGYIRHLPYAKIVILGGDYQNKSQVMVGPLASKCAENFFVDKLFIGTDGFIEKFGFTGNDHLRSAIVKSMATQAKKVIVLTESEKFNRHGVVALISLDETSMVITDSAIQKEKELLLIDKNIDVKKVDDKY